MLFFIQKNSQEVYNFENVRVFFSLRGYFEKGAPCVERWFFDENGTLLQQNDCFSRTTKPDRPSIWRKREIRILDVFSLKSH